MSSSPEQPQPLGAVLAATRAWVDRLGPIWVEGQVIELKRRPGTLHFLTLRDRLAEVSASVSVPSDVLDAAGPLNTGMTVTCRVKPMVMIKNGSLSLACSELRPSGEGRLLAQLEQRKRVLAAEGLFDPRLKKRLPFLPRAIGLITGADSAAERDVIENVRRRWPGAVLEVRHTLVQGQQAATQVMERLGELDSLAQVEVIVIARGGGSLEDLLPFSDEGLVRAVAGARTPVVSAIGHETDTPILDLVADVRASTPTDAAKRVVPDVTDELDRVEQARTRIRRAIRSFVDTEQHQLEQIRNRPSLTDPLYGFALRHDQIRELRGRGRRAIDNRLRQEHTAVENALSRVRAMSPKHTLERGYAILADGAGDGVTSAEQVDLGDDLQVYLADGQLIVEVRSNSADPDAYYEGDFE